MFKIFVGCPVILSNIKQEKQKHDGKSVELESTKGTPALPNLQPTQIM